MLKKSFVFCFLTIILLSVVLSSQPRMWKHDVILYLSDGTEIKGLIVDVKIDSTGNRSIVIWKHGSYISYAMRDIEALRSECYPISEIKRDLNRIKWSKRQDCLVTVERITCKKTNYLWGTATNYTENGILKFASAQLKINEVGAIYFHESAHKHFTTIKNPFALPSTLDKKSSQDESVEPEYPNRSPDLVLTYPANLRMLKSVECKAGDQFYILVEGTINAGEGIIGPGGQEGPGGSRIRGDVQCGIVMVFVAPSVAGAMKLPQWQDLTPIGVAKVYETTEYGAIYLTLNDSILENNSGSFTVKIWKL